MKGRRTQMNMYHYSQRGASHVARKIENQDSVYSVSANNVDVIAVADGCGACVNAAIGSNFVTKFICKYATEHFEELGAMSNEELKTLIVKNFVINYPNLEIKTALSTLLVAAKKNSKLLVIQIGDGKIIFLSNGVSSQAFADDGLPMDQSYTWHSNSACFGKMLFDASDFVIDFILLCTDGVYKPVASAVEFNNGFSYLDPYFTRELYLRKTSEDYQKFIEAVVTMSNGHYADVDDKTAALMLVR